MTSSTESNGVDRDEEAALWCILLTEGELPRPEQNRFDAWIASPENARAFDEVATIWNSVDTASDMPLMIQLRGTAFEHYRRASRRRWRLLPNRWAWLGMIAAATIILVLGTTLLLRDQVQRFSTATGERRVALLDDGSRLSLDAASEVEVRFARERRDLTLVRGRAKFDVSRDPLRPFTVRAGGKMVVATGTSFTVELLRRQIHVLLYTGRVDVLDEKDGKLRPQRVAAISRGEAADTALVPGRELVVPLGSAAPAMVATADAKRSLSWEGGQLTFDDEPLPIAAERMNRYSVRKITLVNPAVARLRVTGVFTAGDTDAFVEGLIALHPVRAERSASEIKLTS